MQEKKSDTCKENEMKLLKTERTITIVLELLLHGMGEGRWHMEYPRQEGARAGAGADLGHGICLMQHALMLCHAQYQGVEVIYMSAGWCLATSFMLHLHSRVLHSSETG